MKITESGLRLIMVCALAAGAATALGLTTDQILQNVYDSSNMALRANIVAGGGGGGFISGSLTDGSLVKASGTTTVTAYTGASACSAGSAVTALSAAGASTCTAGLTSGLTTGLIPVASSATALADSVSYRVSKANSSSTGTTVNKTAKLNSSNQLVIMSAGDTAGIFGIVESGAGTTGSAIVTLLGATTCVSDNSTTAGHYAGLSSSVAGDCTDLGASFPTNGTAVIGTWTETGSAAARGILFNTPDVASVSSGGGGGGNKNPAGAQGDVQYRANSNAFAAEAAFNYDASNNILTLTAARESFTGLTLTDGQNVLAVAATMPSSIAGTNSAISSTITSAGSSSQTTNAESLTYAAGYTGSSATRGLSVSNAVVGTGATPNVGSSTLPVGNIGVLAQASGAGAGDTFAVVGDASGSTGMAAGIYGRSTAAVAGTNYGGVFTAANSTEATNFKNVAGYFSLATTDPATHAVNADRVLVAVGGTLTTSSNIFSGSGTFTSNTTNALGYNFTATGAGSAAQITRTAQSFLAAGYSGSLESEAHYMQNSSTGTGACGLTSNTNTGFGGACSPSNSGGNASISALTNGSTAGENFGIHAEAQQSTTANVGVMGKAVDTVAGTNFGVIGVASNSSEATNWKNIGGLFSVGNNTDLATIADNSSAALVAMSDGTVDIFRGYSTGSTKIVSITTAGNFSTGGTITSTRTSDIGWSVQAAANQACNTTCTSACVFGVDSGSTANAILACTDATADTCLCAGAS